MSQLHAVCLIGRCFCQKRPRHLSIVLDFGSGHDDTVAKPDSFTDDAVLSDTDVGADEALVSEVYGRVDQDVAFNLIPSGQASVAVPLQRS